jgi:Tfp pilus assembly protein PilF
MHVVQNKGTFKDFKRSLYACLLTGAAVFLFMTYAKNDNKLQETDEVSPEESDTLNAPSARAAGKKARPPARAAASDDGEPAADNSRDELRGSFAEREADDAARSAADEKLKKAMDAVDAGDAAGAEKLLSEIIAADPKNERALTELGMIRLIDQRNPAGAIPYFEKVAALNPDNTGVLEELVNIYQDAGRLEQGNLFLVELARKNPGNVDIERNIGRNFASMGRYEEASQHMKSAAAAAPKGIKSAETFEELGDLQAESGDLQGALESYRESMSAIDGLSDAGTYGNQRTMLDLKYIHSLIGIGKRDEAEDMLARMEQEDPGNEMVVAMRRELQQQREEESL